MDSLAHFLCLHKLWYIQKHKIDDLQTLDIMPNLKEIKV